MAEEQGRKRLGRGLAALMGDVSADAGFSDRDRERARGLKRVPIAFLRPNPRNPRRTFAEADLEDLANSIRERGVFQPILVRPVAGETEAYEIIAGERRWRASQRAGLHEVPILVREVDDREALEIAIIENVQRADLNALEEGGGYQQLMNEFAYSQSELAQVIGKSRSHVANTMRLLKLPERVKEHLAEGRLTAGHARALLTAPDPEALAETIVAKGLTVRDAEALAQKPLGDAVKAAAKAQPKDPDTLALERRLADGLGLTVSLAHRATGAGEVRIRYASLEQLDEICRRLEQG
ncbi:ParB/RepB/Spo0J family partition protein [Segnochrobactrum spirostomi]|uniref:ParB/RepB/Spo0J family partition protein n=1 Tax=Segnochrobactrum spirostomi TaxID=2608987 RepID=A0A6A7Y586_9HYPH|nr:ParB/RepB/Spo0J family partition protein [Segnochrobactrum spirostomi]MQT12872.1 ParB/RepB/Spo0J family partition protein [Segnochrobactrum spirostomi]